MGKKYIVELESGTHIFILGPEGIVHIGEPDVVYGTFDGMQIGDAVINAKPYTEPDLGQVRKVAYKIGYEKGYRDGVNRIGDAEDKIRKEAYEEGKKQAKVQAELDVCHDIEKVAKANYQQGINDAWEAARKITLDDINFIGSAFGSGTRSGIIRDLTASEVIKVLKDYEQKQDAEIKVGDEVTLKCGVRPAIYMQGTKGSDEIYLLFNDGSCGPHSKSEIERKTGRHFPEIAAVLEKMRGEQDG